jgi:hypothetical protein
VAGAFAVDASLGIIASVALGLLLIWTSYRMPRAAAAAGKP